MAQIAGPLAAADISAYYISTFNFDHALVSAAGWGQGPWRDAEGVGWQEVAPAGPGSWAALTPPSVHLPAGS